MSNITIVGCGNSGCAHAAVLSALGHRVTLLKTSNGMHDANYDRIVEQKGIYCIDSHDADASVAVFQPVYRITRDVDRAFEDAEFVFVLTQSLQHEKIAALICPKIQNIKLLVIIPGNLGSVFFRKNLPASVIIAEGESTVIDARIEKAGTVRILFHNVRNALSFNPQSQTSKGFELIRSLGLNYTHTRTNVIETALNNPNLVVHTVGTIMSAARIEKSEGEFWMYKEGFTPSIWKIIDSLDDEKMAVIRAYGGNPQPYLECCKFRNEESEDIDAYQAFQNYAQNGSPKGPSAINTRYLTEDVPNGLCLLSSLGKKANIETPTTDALIAIASVMLGMDFRATGRTVERMGWSDYTFDEIKQSI